MHIDRPNDLLNPRLFIFLVTNSYNSFMTKNLIRYLLSLNCQYLPQNTRTFFARLKKNVGPYRWVFTVLYILEFFTGNFGKMLLTLRPLSFEYCDHSVHCDQKNTYFVL